jgi:hypothetical protein
LAAFSINLHVLYIGQENLYLPGNNLISKNIKEIKTKSKIIMINPENPRKKSKLSQIVIYGPNSKRFNSSISDRVAFRRKTVYRIT